MPNIARLVRAARAASVPVVHCVAMRRPDGQGSNHNARLFMGMLKTGVAAASRAPRRSRSSPRSASSRPTCVLSRLHGLGPMGGTDLDPILRNLGVTTIVGVGVSVNVAMLNFAMDAVNDGYQFVMPRDAVAGIPEDYAEAVLDNTISLLATLPTTDEVLAAWSA